MSHRLVDGFRLVYFLGLSREMVLGYFLPFSNPSNTKPLDARGAAACYKYYNDLKIYLKDFVICCFSNICIYILDL